MDTFYREGWEHAEASTALRRDSVEGVTLYSFGARGEGAQAEEIFSRLVVLRKPRRLAETVHGGLAGNSF